MVPSQNPVLLVAMPGGWLAHRPCLSAARLVSSGLAWAGGDGRKHHL